jgi:hypothetical protein
MEHSPYIGRYTPLKMELKIDDTDWDIDIKLQLNLMSKAMKAWGRTDITKDHPYGKNWDLFMFGHCLEVSPSLILLKAGSLQQKRRSLLYIPRLYSPPCRKTV